MAEDPILHERLIARQSDEELERKWRKAEGRWSNNYWAQEWLDVADRRAHKLWLSLGWDQPDADCVKPEQAQETKT